MATQRERQIETRQRLLSAARQVFAENGYPRATVAEIVKRAGRSQGTFYLHFTDKESVLRALLEDAMARLSLQSTSLREHDETGANLRDIVSRFIEEFGEDRDLWLLLDQRSSLEPAFKAMSDQWFQQLAGSILGAIASTDSPSMMNGLDSATLSQIFAAMLSDSTRAAYQESRNWSTKEMAQEISAIWTRTLGLAEDATSPTERL